MNNYLPMTREGNAKEDGTEKTHTNTPGPERANPERARKKKSGGRRKRTKTSGHGEKDGSAYTNLPRRNPSQPGNAQDPNLSGRETTNQTGDQWRPADETKTNQGIQFSNLKVQLVLSTEPVVGLPGG